MGALVSALLVWSWVSADSGLGTCVDVVGLSGEGLMELAEKYTEDAPIPASEPLLPSGYGDVTRWTLVTPKGVTTREVASRYIRRGAGEDHLLYCFDGAAVRDGLAFSGALPKATALRAVKPKRMGKAAQKRFMAQVLEAHEAAKAAARAKREAEIAAGAGSDPETAEEEGEPAPLVTKLGAKDIELVTLKAPEGPRTLAFLHLPQGDDGPTSYLSAVAVVRPDGEVSSWIIQPSVNLNAQAPRFVVDLEGEGREALVYDDWYYEGSYRLLMRLGADGKAEVTTLTGDGA